MLELLGILVDVLTWIEGDRHCGLLVDFGDFGQVSVVLALNLPSDEVPGVVFEVFFVFLVSKNLLDGLDDGLIRLEDEQLIVDGCTIFLLELEGALVVFLALFTLLPDFE